MGLTIRKASQLARTRRASETPEVGGEAAGGSAPAPDDLARMPIQLERLPFALLGNVDQSQAELGLSFPAPAGREGTWLIAADWDGRERDPGTPAQLPGPMANDVLVAIGRATRMAPEGTTLEQLKNIDSRTVSLSVTELLELMGVRKSGHAYETLLETCHRLGRVAVTTQNAWKVDGEWVRETLTFPLFEKVRTISRGESPGGTRVEFRISYELARAQFEHGRLLETKTYRQLHGDTARRLFRLLEVERHAEDSRGVSELRIPLSYLRDRLPLVASKQVYIRRSLNTAHAELEAVGYLAPLPEDERYVPAEPEDYRRFMSYPGARSKPIAAYYRILRDPVERAPKISAEEKARLLAAVGVVTAGSGESDLAGRVREVQSVVEDRENVGLYTALCKALPEEAYRRVVATIRADRPTNKRAAFVRLAKDELARHNLPVPQAAKDNRTLAKLL